jgi:hypothetical protein
MNSASEEERYFREEGYSPIMHVLAFKRELERQEKLCGFDPWRNDLEANRKNIERFALYSSYAQGLSCRQWKAEELFLPLDTTD